MVYGLLRALPGDPACLTPSPMDNSIDLTPATEASGPHDLAVRFRAVRQRRIRVHRIPFRVRDDREPPPLEERDGRHIQLICNFCKSEYFYRRGLTGFTDLPDRAVMLICLDKPPSSPRKRGPQRERFRSSRRRGLSFGYAARRPSLNPTACGYGSRLGGRDDEVCVALLVARAAPSTPVACFRSCRRRA
jgi:hypothetical protein